MKKIGILGGTFDPPHIGHLLIGQEVLEHFLLDEIWFMPVNIPPHKKQKSATTSKERKDMVELAILDNNHFLLSTLELDRDGPSYTIDTLRQLKQDYPTNHFYFIIGGDMLEQLPNWYQINELLQLVTFIGLRRPGFQFSNPVHEQIILMDVPQVDISSSLIRKRIAAGKSVRYLIPESVRIYIMERGLYEQGRSTTNR